MTYLGRVGNDDEGPSTELLRLAAKLPASYPWTVEGGFTAPTGDHWNLMVWDSFRLRSAPTESAITDQRLSSSTNLLDLKPNRNHNGSIRGKSVPKQSLGNSGGWNP